VKTKSKKPLSGTTSNVPLVITKIGHARLKKLEDRFGCKPSVVMRKFIESGLDRADAAVAAFDHRAALEPR
jgi:hypothetical protein